MKAVIMAGGSGKRFWPLSRKLFPKQYLKLIAGKSLLQLSFERVSKFLRAEDIYIVTTREQEQLILEQLPEVTKKNIIIEPYGKNTALCVMLSLRHLVNSNLNQDTNVLFMPADHFVENQELFTETFTNPEGLKQYGLSLIGIVPDYPATGYGYIEVGKEIADSMFHVKHFKEKPDLVTAKQYLESGNFLWNSGMFLGRLESYLSEFHDNMPLQFSDLFIKKKSAEDVYSYSEAISFDYAILEKSKELAVIKADFSWSDVGSWRSLHELNRKLGLRTKNLYELNSKDNFVYSKKKVALLDVSDLVVVETEDVILVCPKNSSERVKDMADFAADRNRELI